MGKNLLSPNFDDYLQSKTYLYDTNVVPPNTSARCTLKNKDTTIKVQDCNLGFVDNSILTNKVTQYRWAVRSGVIQNNLTNHATIDGTQCQNVMINPRNQAILKKLFARWDIMVELGTVATDFVPYQGEIYNITLPAEAGTVYGGTLDVTSGTLTVDRAMIASYDGESLPGEWISDRDAYEAGSTTTTGAQVVYKLTEPITYTIIVPQVRTLLGENHIWADTGAVEVTYRADTKLYIEQLTQPTEDDMTANANIASGTFFMVGNTLYISTSAIEQGAAIVPGTNCTELSLADALNSLNT